MLVYVDDAGGNAGVAADDDDDAGDTAGTAAASADDAGGSVGAAAAGTSRETSLSSMCLGVWSPRYPSSSTFRFKWLYQRLRTAISVL